MKKRMYRVGNTTVFGEKLLPLVKAANPGCQIEEICDGENMGKVREEKPLPDSADGAPIHRRKKEKFSLAKLSPNSRYNNSSIYQSHGKRGRMQKMLRTHRHISGRFARSIEAELGFFDA